MSDKIYVIGHKSPDLDSVAAAISYSVYKNALEETDRYVPAIAGELNNETKFTLEKFGYATPELLVDATGKSLILVDHNEMSQAVNGAEQATILEVIDHHKVGFKYNDPIIFMAMPWGSSCSVIASLFKQNNIAVDAKLAGLMLSAVLVDTVITKSPTCTSVDKMIIEELAKLAGIIDWHSYGMDLFMVRSNVTAMTVEQIIKSDFKDFEFKTGKFGIGQVETVNLTEFAGRESEILTKLEEMRLLDGYHSVVLFITDIIKEGSEFYISSSDMSGFEKALDANLVGGKTYVPGILSRKKQVIPKFSEIFDK